MRRFLKRAGIVLLAVVTSVPAHGADQTIRLVCRYSKSVTSDGRIVGNSTQALITVTFSASGSAVIKKQGLTAEFIGTVTDDEISGRSYSAINKDPNNPGENIEVHRTININRYTGELISEYRVGSSGTTDFANCKVAEKPLF